MHGEKFIREWRWHWIEPFGNMQRDCWPFVIKWCKSAMHLRVRYEWPTSEQGTSGTSLPLHSTRRAFSFDLNRLVAASVKYSLPISDVSFVLKDFICFYPLFSQDFGWDELKPAETAVFWMAFLGCSYFSTHSFWNSCRSTDRWKPFP